MYTACASVVYTLARDVDKHVGYVFLIFEV